MNILKEPIHATEFIISESGGSLSREAVMVTAGEALPAGQLLILDESNRTYQVYSPEVPTDKPIRTKSNSRAAGETTEPSEPVTPTLAVLVNPLPADTLTRRAAACVRLAEISRPLLTGLDKTAETFLATRFLIVR